MFDGIFRKTRDKEALADVSPDEREICAFVAPYTKTSIERRLTLMRAIAHVVKTGIPGAVVETGVWRGGSMMVVARALMRAGDTSRTLYLYDTYAGMTAPSDKDRKFDGASAQDILDHTRKGHGVWCEAGLEDVRRNLALTAYPQERLVFVEGKVEDTIPGIIPDQISILRLDTDWYELTKHALHHLYPRLSSGGFLILDDYGHWQGARYAVDEFFAAQSQPPFLHRVDYTCRLVVKP